MDVTTLFVTGVVTVVAIIVFGIVVAVVMSENPMGRTNDSK
jgi:hypothetical protein